MATVVATANGRAWWPAMAMVVAGDGYGGGYWWRARGYRVWPAMATVVATVAATASTRGVGDGGGDGDERRGAAAPPLNSPARGFALRLRSGGRREGKRRALYRRRALVAGHCPARD